MFLGAVAPTIFVTKQTKNHLLKGALAPTMLDIIGANSPLKREQSERELQI